MSVNKQFKSDSQRMAFFIPSLGFVFKVASSSSVVALFTLNWALGFTLKFLRGNYGKFC